MSDLKPDFCPKINLIMENDYKSKKTGGMVLHDNKYCVCKKIEKKSFLYKMFNLNKSDNKITHLMKVHNVDENNKNLKSINFIGITKDEFKKKRQMYDEDKKKLH